MLIQRSIVEYLLGRRNGEFAFCLQLYALGNLSCDIDNRKERIVSKSKSVGMGLPVLRFRALFGITEKGLDLNTGRKAH